MATQNPNEIQYPVNKTINANTVSYIKTNLGGEGTDTIIVDVDTTNLGTIIPEEDENGNFVFRASDGSLVFNPNVEEGEYLESDFTKSLTYKNVTVYILAEQSNNGDYTDYNFWFKENDNYYPCMFEVHGYYPHTEDTTLPSNIAKYIDALSVYINGNKAELATYPNVV